MDAQCRRASRNASPFKSETDPITGAPCLLIEYASLPVLRIAEAAFVLPALSVPVVVAQPASIANSQKPINLFITLP